jgi:hypothetical protein
MAMQRLSSSHSNTRSFEEGKGGINAQVCATRPPRNFFATNVPDPPYWTLNSYFGVFLFALLLHESWCKMGRIGAINAQFRAMKSC